MHTGRRVFRDTAWIWMLALCVLLGHLNPLGRSENLNRNSFSTSRQEFSPFGIISKNSFCCHKIRIKTCLRGFLFVFVPPGMSIYLTRVLLCLVRKLSSHSLRKFCAEEGSKEVVSAKRKFIKALCYCDYLYRLNVPGRFSHLKPLSSAVTYQTSNIHQKSALWPRQLRHLHIQTGIGCNQKKRVKSCMLLSELSAPSTAEPPPQGEASTSPTLLLELPGSSVAITRWVLSSSTPTTHRPAACIHQLAMLGSTAPCRG